MSRQQLSDKVELLGVEVDCLSVADAINLITGYSALGQPAVYVVKPYVEFLERAYHDPAISDRLNHAELCLADGVALLWAAHYLYAGPRTIARFWLSLSKIIFAPRQLAWPIPERLAGINFTWPLLEAARDHSIRVFLIGQETPHDIEHVAATVKTGIAGINIVGALCGRDPQSPRGSVSETWLADTATAVTQAKADLILVGMGFPLQEEVCAALSSRCSHGVFIGEGGTFDYELFGGQRRKAPAWLQKVGLEWLWRLILQPTRFGRQLAIPRFIWHIYRSR